jgi:hypothetical protein
MSALIVMEDERMNLVVHSQAQLQQLATGATWGKGLSTALRMTVLYGATLTAIASCVGVRTQE